MIKSFEDIYPVCVDPNVDGDPKKQGIFVSSQKGTYGGVTLVFARATHEQIDALAAEMRKLGLNEARVE